MGDTPTWFKCPVARREYGLSSRDADRQHRVDRTGRTKPRRTRRPGARALDTSHEYRCSCGHVGWTTHMDILHRPLRPR